MNPTLGTYVISQEELLTSSEQFIDKILSDVEVDEYRKTNNQLNYLAKRYVAKYSLMFALRKSVKSLPNWFDLRMMTVVHDVRGRPDIIFDNDLLIKLKGIGFKKCFISMSDDENLTLGFAYVER